MKRLLVLLMILTGSFHTKFCKGNDAFLSFLAMLVKNLQNVSAFVVGLLLVLSNVSPCKNGKEEHDVPLFLFPGKTVLIAFQNFRGFLLFSFKSV